MTKNEKRQAVKAVIVDLYTSYDGLLDIGKNSGDKELRKLALELGDLIQKIDTHIYTKEA